MPTHFPDDPQAPDSPLLQRVAAWLRVARPTDALGHPRARSHDAERSWAMLRPRLADHAAGAAVPPRRDGRGVRYGWVASGAVVVLIGLWASHTLTVRGIVPPTVYTTQPGQRANLRLADGTLVTLNVASRLEVPANYAAGHRALRLTGEAVFLASHRENAPFTVAAGPIVARVLGTRFAVRHYQDDTATTVAVSEGRVAVRTAVLSAQQQASIGSSGVMRLQHADASRFSFAAGVLAFNGVALRDAIPDLNRWYDAEIRLASPALATQRLEGNIPAGSLDDLTELLTLTFPVRIVRTGRVLTLYPR